MNPVTDDSTAQSAQAQTAVNDDLARALASVQAGPQDSMNFEPVGEPEMSSVPGVDLDEPVPAAPAAPAPKATPAPIPVPAPAPMPEPAMTSDAAAPEFSTPTASVDHDASADDSIEQIKIAALQQLRPLMQHIELTPEEKFEKYLMMLRASDDPSLIQPTYDAAEQISSEKLKAQALLDVINEINYLTSQQLI